MIEVIQDNIDRYLKFWRDMGRITVSPIFWVEYFARRDTDYKNGMIYVFFSLTTIVAVQLVILGQDVTDLSHYLASYITNSILLVLSCIAYSISWKLCGYRGDFQLLVRANLYFTAVLMIFLGSFGVIAIGYLKVFFSDAFSELSNIYSDCTIGMNDKLQYSAEIMLENPTTKYFLIPLDIIVSLFLISYSIASFRLNLRFFEMSVPKRIGTIVSTM